MALKALRRYPEPSPKIFFKIANANAPGTVMNTIFVQVLHRLIFFSPSPIPKIVRGAIARTISMTNTMPAYAQEWRRLLDESAPHLQRILIVLYTLGSRRGELLSLEWPDVDMHRREFTLRHTKNGESRTVPMTPEIYRVFTELWQERRLDTQRVFLYKGLPIRDVKTAFDKACRRAGITNLRLHDLRHTASTNLRRQGGRHNSDEDCRS